MIRVLQCVNNMHRAGLETMLMNYYRHIDRNEIQFDFLTHRPEKADYDEEIEALGGRVYYAPRLYPQNLTAYYRFMDDFFKEHPEYKIMHSHIDSMSYLPLKAGKLGEIPIRIAHSHNTSIDMDFKYLLKQYYRYRIPSVATDFFSCGQEAGEFLFKGQSFTVIPNAIETEPFKYDEEIRKDMRNELQLTDEFVIGHVGRISYQKNHKYLIRIFNEILKCRSNAILLIIGVGEDENVIRKMVENYGISSKVRFLGKRSDVSRLYQAMDAFVMPSLFEGVPMVGVEAQFAKLPCFFSDRVPKEVGISDATSFIELEKSPSEWARTIIDSVRRIDNRNNIQIHGEKFDISKSSHVLVDMYMSLMSKNNITG